MLRSWLGGRIAGNAIAGCWWEQGRPGQASGTQEASTIMVPQSELRDFPQKLTYKLTLADSVLGPQRTYFEGTGASDAA